MQFPLVKMQALIDNQSTARVESEAVLAAKRKIASLTAVQALYRPLKGEDTRIKLVQSARKQIAELELEVALPPKLELLLSACGT